MQEVCLLIKDLKVLQGELFWGVVGELGGPVVPPLQAVCVWGVRNPAYVVCISVPVSEQTYQLLLTFILFCAVGRNTVAGDL